MVKQITISVLVGIFVYFSCASLAIAKNQNPKTFVGPARGTISSLFGWRVDPFRRTQAFHCGLDIASKKGTPIYALQEGFVKFTGVKGGYGKTVTILHQYPDIPEIPVVETMYAHNSKILVKENQFVKRGDIIALMGSTGRSTGPHLHFEVHYNGGYVDPIDYLVKLPKYLEYIAYKRSHYYAYKKQKTVKWKIKPHVTKEEAPNYKLIED